MNTRIKFIHKLLLPQLVLLLAVGNLVFASPILADSAKYTEQKLLPADSAIDPTGDIANEIYNFGSAIALSGNTLAVGYDTSGAGAKRVAIYVRNGSSFGLQSKLSPVASDGFSHFGRSIALEGDTVAIGALGSDGQGIMYIFQRSGTVWTQQTILSPNDSSPGDGFACSLAISGDTVVAGAVSGKSDSAGSVYAFKRVGSIWIQQTKLTITDSATGRYFGVRVSLSGNTAAILGWGLNQAPGAVYIFTRDGSSWTQQAKLTAGVTTDYFGGDVSISGDTFVVSAPSIQRAFVFVRSGTEWTAQALLDPLTHYGPPVPLVGSSVSISGDNIILQGGYSTSDTAIHNYIYSRSGTTWSRSEGGMGGQGLTGYLGGEVAISGNVYAMSVYWNNFNPGSINIMEKLNTPVTSSSPVSTAPIILSNTLGKVQSDLINIPREFGVAVALSGQTLVVGSPGDNGTKGAAFVFEQKTTGWQQTGVITASDSAVGDFFGTSVAIANDTLVIGENGHYTKSGKVYVFVRQGTGWVQRAILAPDIADQREMFGGSVSLTGNYLVVGAGGNSTTSDAGAAYIFAGQGTAWTLQAKLLPDSSTKSGDMFGNFVSIDGDTAIVNAYINGTVSYHVFVRTGSTWARQTVLIPSDMKPGLWQMSDVSISGDSIVGSGCVTSAGKFAAYVFTRTGTSWSEQAKLLCPPIPAINGFTYGISVSIKGDLAVVSSEMLADSGAYLFARTGAVWTYQYKLAGSDIATNDNFGNDVAFDGHTLVVGAQNQRAGAGASYVFSNVQVSTAANPGTASLNPTTSPVNSSTVSSVVATTSPLAETQVSSAAPTNPEIPITSPVATPVPAKPLTSWLLIPLFALVIAGGIVLIYSRRSRT